jgi:hypothetical protein
LPFPSYAVPAAVDPVWARTEVLLLDLLETVIIDPLELGNHQKPP